MTIKESLYQWSLGLLKLFMSELYFAKEKVKIKW